MLTLVSQYNQNQEEELNTEQQDWLNNPDRCPACGTWIESAEHFCADCGIRLPHDRVKRAAQRKKKNKSSGFLQQEGINYVYTKKPSDSDPK